MGFTSPASGLASVQELLRSRCVHLARIPHVKKAPAWNLEELSGRLVELSADAASASLTVAAALVLEAQQAGEPCAWILQQEDGTFYPPDFAANGIDLAALAVIQIPSHQTDPKRGPQKGRQQQAMLLAADRLLRCGAYGLVILDFGEKLDGGRLGNTFSLAAQSRLSGLAQRHDAILLCLTQRMDPEASGSLGSLVSLHATTQRSTTQRSTTRRSTLLGREDAASKADSRFCCEIRIIKDKRRGPGRIHRQQGYHGPAGLR